MSNNDRFTVEEIPMLKEYCLIDKNDELLSPTCQLVLKDEPAIKRLCEFLNQQENSKNKYKTKCFMLASKLSNVDKIIEERIAENNKLSELQYTTGDSVDTFTLCNMELLRVREMIHNG